MNYQFYKMDIHSLTHQWTGFSKAIGFIDYKNNGKVYNVYSLLNKIRHKHEDEAIFPNLHLHNVY